MKPEEGLMKRIAAGEVKGTYCGRGKSVSLSSL
jgi:hypothetical protein